MKIEEIHLKEFNEDLNTINMELERIKSNLTQLLKDNDNEEAIFFYASKVVQYVNSKEKIKEYIKKLEDEIKKEKEGDTPNDKLANAK